MFSLVGCSRCSLTVSGQPGRSILPPYMGGVQQHILLVQLVRLQPRSQIHSWVIPHEELGDDMKEVRPSSCILFLQTVSSIRNHG